MIALGYGCGDRDINLNSFCHTGWRAFFLDTTSEVLLMNDSTGAVREAPWISLRTSTGIIFFANLVSRETRWLPPHRWMENWLYWRPVDDGQLEADQHPYSHVDCSASLECTRASPVASYGRRPPWKVELLTYTNVVYRNIVQMDMIRLQPNHWSILIQAPPQ